MKFNLFLFFLTFVLVIATASAIPAGFEGGNALDKRGGSCDFFGDWGCKASCRSHNGICCPCNIAGRKC
ncbi:3258_t:CDS:2 [Ambispora gerdemannii]|uniref:3258_t:CDS:1 n=1 Tax=Ambispora gerdemannii TaxID=144530 RepID=A0A9N8YUF3_9GLOM|nr:3258_t:CDS:2 [Ambispora gerdemannii]